MAFPYKKKKQSGTETGPRPPRPTAPKVLTEEQAYPRLLRYCAYQERGPAEVRTRMKTYGLDTAAQERMLERLREENYLSEDRFTSAYAGGKLRNNRWGHARIRQGLQAKGIDADRIHDAIANTDKDEYTATLDTLLTRADEQRYKHLPLQERRHKLFRTAITKGFEVGLVKEAIDRLLKSERS